MASQSFTPSAACCSTPVAIIEPYDYKGAFIDIDGTKTYVTGPESATKAVFVLYDVFGFSHQIIQGADLLAAAGFRVFMPDFFEGQPAPLSMMPMEGPADEEGLEKFCNERGDTQKTLKRVAELQKHCQEMQPGIQNWGLAGYCWGGYIVPYAIGSETVFNACVACHPGFPEVEIAEQVSVPYLALCSKDEVESEYAHFKPALKVENHFEVFHDMVHGWLSARSALEKDDVKADFHRGYSMMIEWFQKYL